MIGADQIPPEVVEALAMAWRDEMNSAHAIAAAINAWPGAEYVYRQPHRRAVSYSSPAIILPLPMENTNAEG